MVQILSSLGHSELDETRQLRRRQNLALSEILFLLFLGWSTLTFRIRYQEIGQAQRRQTLGSLLLDSKINLTGYFSQPILIGGFPITEKRGVKNASIGA
jgi:hypothetical protein